MNTNVSEIVWCYAYNLAVKVVIFWLWKHYSIYVGSWPVYCLTSHYIKVQTPKIIPYYPLVDKISLVINKSSILGSLMWWSIPITPFMSGLEKLFEKNLNMMMHLGAGWGGGLVSTKTSEQFPQIVVLTFNLFDLTKSHLTVKWSFFIVLLRFNANIMPAVVFPSCSIITTLAMWETWTMPLDATCQ